MDFIDFKSLFESWTHTKEEDEQSFKEEMDKLRYNNGRILFNDEGIPIVKLEVKVYLTERIDIQEMMIIEFDIGYPISKINYAYASSLYQRVACNWNISDWEYVERDYNRVFQDTEVLLVCYNYTERLINTVPEDILQFVERVYEIRTDTYHVITE